jgi:hypothetical protein
MLSGRDPEFDRACIELALVAILVGLAHALCRIWGEC